MKLKFNIEYYTAPGEEIVLNILDDGARRERCPMTTADGSQWTCELALASLLGIEFAQIGALGTIHTLVAAGQQAGVQVCVQAQGE